MTVARARGDRTRRAARTLAGAVVVAAACRPNPLPRPPAGPQGPRPTGALCDFSAEFPPPPAQIEVVELRDRPADPACVWADGYWRWEARRWTWVRGAWVRVPEGCHRAAAAAYWLPGKSEHGTLCVLYPRVVTATEGEPCPVSPCAVTAPPPADARAALHPAP